MRSGVFLETEALSELAILLEAMFLFDAKAEARGILRGSLRDFRFDDAIFEVSGPIVEIKRVRAARANGQRFGYVA